MKLRKINFLQKPAEKIIFFSMIKTVPECLLTRKNAIETIWCLDETNYEAIFTEICKFYDTGCIQCAEIFETLGTYSTFHLKNLPLAHQMCNDFAKKYQIKSVCCFIASHSLRKMLENDKILDTTSCKQVAKTAHVFALRQNNLYFSQKLTNQDVIDVYPYDSLEYAIVHDDIEGFKQNFESFNDYDLEFKITIIDSPFYTELLLVDACAYYGALRCFEYLNEKGAVFSTDTFRCAVIGGNPKIIHLCEDKPNIKIDNVSLDLAIRAHHYIIANWLEVKYNLRFSWLPILEAKNYRFLFAKLKKVTDINCIDSRHSTILNAATALNNVDIIDWIRDVSNKHPMNLKKLASLVTGHGYTRSKSIIVHHHAFHA